MIAFGTKQNPRMSAIEQKKPFFKRARIKKDMAKTNRSEKIAAPCIIYSPTQRSKMLQRIKTVEADCAKNIYVPVLLASCPSICKFPQLFVIANIMFAED